MKTICVFCGARSGTNPEIVKLVSNVGEERSKQKLTMIYGGSDSGLMGVLADAALNNNGSVVGVFPNTLSKIRTPHTKLTDLIRTACISSRKQKMLDISDAFLVLPGGYGTLDEVFEVIVLCRLNAYSKPIILFNYNGFWDGILSQINRMIQEGFVGKNETHPFNIVEDMQQFKAALSSFVKA